MSSLRAVELYVVLSTYNSFHLSFWSLFLQSSCRPELKAAPICRWKRCPGGEDLSQGLGHRALLSPCPSKMSTKPAPACKACRYFGATLSKTACSSSEQEHQVQADAFKVSSNPPRDPPIPGHPALLWRQLTSTSQGLLLTSSFTRAQVHPFSLNHL